MYKDKKLIAIALVAANGVVGNGEDQPLRFKEDFANFKKVTHDQCLIVGRRTFDAMGWLPGRKVIVITNHLNSIDYSNSNPGEAFAQHSLENALDLSCCLSKDTDKVFIGGGQHLWTQSWNMLDELELSIANVEATGHVVFPHFDQLNKEFDQISEIAATGFRFTRWIRK